MNKPLDIKALDVFLSAVEDRLAHLESKMGMYKDEDEEREPVSEDTLEKKASCPDCGMAEGECKCGYFDIDRKTYVVDAETKVRYVRDAAYWGVPVMTPIAPGMKPQGPTSPAGRARRSSMTGRGIRRSMPRTSSGGDKTPGRAAPRKRVKPKTGATSDRPITRQGKDPIPRIGQDASVAKRNESERLFGAKPQRVTTAEDIESAGRRAAAGGRGGKKPPSKPTPSASGDKEPKEVSSARKAWEKDAMRGDLEATRQLEKEGWKWQADPKNPGTVGLSKNGKDFAVTVTPGSDRYGMDDDALAKAYERSKGDQEIPEASTFDYDKLPARQQREYRALTRAQRAEYEDRWNARSAASTERAKERRRSAQLPDGGAAGEGISTTHFGTGGKGPGGSTHRAEIGQDDDGTWRASFTRLNPNHGGESGGRTTVKDKFKSREEAEAWVNNSAKRSKVRANPDGDKEADKERGEISNRVGELMSDGTPIPKDESGKNKFEKVVDEKTGAESYKPAKAEDFSVDSVAKELSNINPEGSPDGSGSVEKPIDVGDDVELAHELLAKGLHVRMKSKEGVSTLIKKVKEIADDAKAKGIEAPNYDFCKVSVPKTNLFCIESKGIPRTKMPQFKGEPHEGSFAETKFNEGKGEADVEPEFRELLEKMGIKTEMKTVKASELKATQDNLVGTKVAGMAGAMREGKIPDAPIFVTRDGYIVDGHHRWAAKIAMDLEDGVMGDVEMPVEVIDGDIGFILDVANGFADLAGIKRKGVGDDADGVKPTTGSSGTSVVLDGVGTVVQSDNTQGKKWWNILDEFSKKSDDDCGCSGNA